MEKLVIPGEMLITLFLILVKFAEISHLKSRPTNGARFKRISIPLLLSSPILVVLLAYPVEGASATLMIWLVLFWSKYAKSRVILFFKKPRLMPSSYDVENSGANGSIGAIRVLVPKPAVVPRGKLKEATLLPY